MKIWKKIVDIAEKSLEFNKKQKRMISTQKHKKCKHYHPKKLINMNILPGEEMQPPDQRRAMNRAKPAYFSLVESFEKQTKTIEEQGKKQIKANEDN